MPVEEQLPSVCTDPNGTSTKKKIANYLKESPRFRRSHDEKLSFSLTNLTQLKEYYHGNPHKRFDNERKGSTSMDDCANLKEQRVEREFKHHQWGKFNGTDGGSPRKFNKIRSGKKMAALESKATQLVLG